MITGTYTALVCIPNFYSFFFERKLKKGELFINNNAIALPLTNNIQIEVQIFEQDINYDQINKFIKEVEAGLGF